MTTATIDEELSWTKLTHTFGWCGQCRRTNRPLFRYQLEHDHYDDSDPDELPLCMVDPEHGRCHWCSRRQQPMLCPPCYGIAAAKERAALDATLTEEGDIDAPTKWTRR